MSKKRILFRKAAVLFAAFFMFIQKPYAAKTMPDSLEVVKKKSSLLLTQKQKTEALKLISDYIKSETNRNLIAEASRFLIKVSQTFLSKEAQDAYEASVNATLESNKEANKFVETCLQLEPQNINCLIQKIRIAYREKNTTLSEKTLEDVLAITRAGNAFLWLDVFLHKASNSENFKNTTLLKKMNELPSEDFFILTVLEIERSFLAKNFSRAKEGVDYLDKNYPDYPDTIFFKQKLDSESIEEKTTNASETNLLYTTKCKSLSKSMARKFRYDFDLCQRGL